MQSPCLSALAWSVSNLSFAYRHLVPAKIFAFKTLLIMIYIMASVIKLVSKNTFVRL